MASSEALRSPLTSHRLSSALKTPNCAKKAHLSSRFPLGGTTEGLRWGDGGGTVGLRDHRGRPIVCHFGTLSAPRLQCQSAIDTLTCHVLLALGRDALFSTRPLTDGARPLPFVLPAKPATASCPPSRPRAQVPAS